MTTDGAAAEHTDLSQNLELTEEEEEKEPEIPPPSVVNKIQPIFAFFFPLAMIEESLRRII